MPGHQFSEAPSDVQQGLLPEVVQPILIHTTLVHVLELRERCDIGGRSIRGDFASDDVPNDLDVLLGELIELAVRRLGRGERIGSEPPAVGVAVEVVAGIDGGVERRENRSGEGDALRSEAWSLQERTRER